MSKIEELIFNELHKAIHESAESILEFDTSTSTYPPGIEFTDEERDALSKLDLSMPAKSALKKLIVDACAYPTFHMFSLLDGVTEPNKFEGDFWTGGKFSPLGQDEEGSVMLHDKFYESYWDFKE